MPEHLGRPVDSHPGESCGSQPMDRRRLARRMCSFWISRRPASFWKPQETSRKARQSNSTLRKARTSTRSLDGRVGICSDANSKSEFQSEPSARRCSELHIRLTTWITLASATSPKMQTSRGLQTNFLSPRSCGGSLDWPFCLGRSWARPYQWRGDTFPELRETMPFQNLTIFRCRYAEVSEAIRGIKDSR